MNLVRLPIVNGNELPPRMRLAQKLRAAIAKSGNRNDKMGELFEISFALRLSQFGWFRAGFQIGRDALPDERTDQKVYVGTREVDGLFRRGLDHRWLIGQAKIPEQGGAQIREAIEFTLFDQVDAATHHRNQQLAGLIYAEPSGVDRIQRKVADNVIMLLREREFSAATTCTREDFKHAVDLNCSRAGLAVSEGTKKLDGYVRDYANFGVPEFRTQMFDDIRRILGVSLIVINPPLVPDERALTTVFEPELQALVAADRAAAAEPGLAFAAKAAATRQK